jgi:hypothetical protein
VIAVPEFWKKPRPGQMETSELKIADNDTILHPDFPRQTLVFSETEIRIFNMLLVSQTRPASTSALLDEFRSSSSRRFIRGPHDVKILKELEELGVITRPQDSSDGTNIGFAQWTLNPNFVIRDIRSELAEAENAEKYHDVEHVIHDVQKKLVADGWAYVTDRMLGFGPELIKEFSGIFASNIMREVPNDRPVGRKRARDVLDFFHLGNAGRIFDDTSEIDTKFSRDPVYLSAAPSNAVINRVANNIDETSRPKEYPRFNVMAYPVIKRFVGMLPRLVPPELRATKGRVCLDAFSVKERPVDGQHKDGVDVVFVRVNRKVGDGARTRLHGRLRDLKPHDSTRPRVSKKIPEGGMLIFLDSRFTHDATPVIPDHLGNSLRETTIGTITYER